MKAKEVADKIGVPVTEWKGNCFYIASLCVKKKIVRGKVRYGHFVGFIHPESMFSKFINAGFAPHGWVELKNNFIFDPTRWVFECKNPYIYEGFNDCYDLGGSAVRNAMRTQRTPPVFDPKHRSIFKLNLSSTAMSVVKAVCNDDRPDNTFTLEQLFWLGNEDYRTLDRDAEEIYTELKRLNLSSLIPIDYWNAIME